MRFNIPERAKELSKEFEPYIDYTKIDLPFKPGTSDSIKKKKEEWKKSWTLSLKRWMNLRLLDCQ